MNARWTSLCALLCALPAHAGPAPAYLVKDIDTAPAPTSFRLQIPQIVESGGVAWFVGYENETGAELWRSDGTRAGTTLVRDILPGTTILGESNGPESITSVNGSVFFVVDDGTRGKELWTSDGTHAGTRIVKDIRPGSTGSEPRQLTNVNGTLFFTADDGVHGRELWKSNGTNAGTVLVKDISPGASSSAPPADYLLSNMANMDGTLFFPACGPSGCFALWKSDGTNAGTVMVKDLPLTSLLYELTAVGGRLFFWNAELNFDIVTAELWTSDGTSAGTVSLGPVGEVDNEAPHLYPFQLTNVGGTLFLSSSGGPSGPRQLWKSDGTPAGTVLVEAIGPSSLTDFDGTLVFAGSDANGIELWKSDGTEAGTVLVKDINPGPGSSLGGGFDAFENVNGTLFFSASDGTTGGELWKSDGTAAGTVFVKEIRAGALGSGPSELTNAGGTLLFAANDGSLAVSELWKSDGTPGGTVKLEGGPIRGGRDFAIANGALFLPASDDAAGAELWKSDGTDAGTTRVKDIRPGSDASNPRSVTNVNGVVFFAADDGAAGPELWRSDGTDAGTVLVKDILPGSAGSNPQYLTNVNGVLFFAADDGATGGELWKSDGTDAGTVRVKDLRVGTTGSAPESLASSSGLLFFIANDGIAGKELWKSDGTDAGTVLLEIAPGSASAFPGATIPLTDVNGTVFFSANGPVGGHELWKSNGTPAGTVLVKNISTLGDGSFPRSLTNVDGTLFFNASPGYFTNSAGHELWKSDGTGAGTVQVKDICPGGSSNPRFMTNPNGTVFLRASDCSSGTELWKSDGTGAGTVRVDDTFVGPDSGNLASMAAVASRVFFTGDDGVSGGEPWTSDGTAAGTQRLADIAPLGGSLPEPLATLGPLFLFSARPDETGWKLYAVATAALADGDGDGLIDAAELALGTNPADSDSEDDGLGDGAEVNVHGTNPLLADTDGDGHGDGDEVLAGSDPLDPGDPPIVPLAGPLALGALAAALLLTARRANRCRTSRSSGIRRP